MHRRTPLTCMAAMFNGTCHAPIHWRSGSLGCTTTSPGGLNTSAAAGGPYMHFTG